MKKVLTFSLWGDAPKYNIGAIRNCELALKYYPDFECWYYIHIETVPENTIIELLKFNNAKIFLKSGDLKVNKPMMWRFEAIDDTEVEIIMSRDTDTRILPREVKAVEEWINSNKIFHIMRDHPYHTSSILGGMFGTRKIPEIDNWKVIMDNFKQEGDIWYDQHFLNNYIYPLIKNNCLVHSSFHKIENFAENFPLEYDNDFRFVGEYVYEDESRNLEIVEILRKSMI